MGTHCEKGLSFKSGGIDPFPAHVTMREGARDLHVIQYTTGCVIAFLPVWRDMLHYLLISLLVAGEVQKHLVGDLSPGIDRFALVVLSSLSELVFL